MLVVGAEDISSVEAFISTARVGKGMQNQKTWW